MLEQGFIDRSGCTPAFDAQGRLAGFMPPTAAGTPGWLPISAIVDAAGAGPAPQSANGLVQRADVDRLYEAALRIALEVFALP